MPLAASATFQDLGPLVLGHHALNLQQQIVLRREADRSIEKDDLDPSPVELVDQQHLIGVAPRQSVGGVDVQAIEVAGRNGIAQTLERGPHQGGSAVAVVDKATIGRQAETVLREAGLQRRDLAVDGVAGRLLLGRDAGVDGDAQGCHAHSLLVRSAVSGVVSRGEPHGSGCARSRRSTIGSRRSNASAMHCFSSRVTSWLTRTLRVGGCVLRRRIGASVIRLSRLGWPTQQQRRTRKAVAVLWSQTIPWDRHRQIERKFCTIVGGVVSPLLSVIYMNRFLKHWRLTGRSETFRAHVVSYADDFVILSRGHAAEALTWTKAVMAKLGLTLNEAKTSLKDARRESFDFLGYTLGPRHFPNGGRWYLGASPSKQSVQRVKAKISELLVPGNKGAWDEVRARLNRILRGWSAYFAYGALASAYEAVDRHVYDRASNFLRQRHKAHGRGVDRFSREHIYGELAVRCLRRERGRSSPWALQ